jgi:hypothetical protein
MLRRVCNVIVIGIGNNAYFAVATVGQNIYLHVDFSLMALVKMRTIFDMIGMHSFICKYRSERPESFG